MKAMDYEYSMKSGNPDANSIREAIDLVVTVCKLPGALKRAYDAFDNDPVEASGYTTGVVTQAIIAKKVGDVIFEAPPVTSSGQVGKYTTKIQWGILEVEARPSGAGFWGKRVPQTNPLVDAFELKINPNNESFYLPHPQGGFVQFENLVGGTLQDGKLVLNAKSIYKVNDLPGFARRAVLIEAGRQVEAASASGLRVEWLVSDREAVSQLRNLFETERVNISVNHFPN